MGLLQGVRRRSLAGQILLLQLLLVVLVVVGGIGLAVTDARRDQRRQAEQTVLGVAATVADSPVIPTALQEPDPTAVLQPYAERVRVDTGTDFVVIMTVQGRRFTHPDPAQIGGQFRGSIAEAARGERHVEQYTGTLGPSVRAVVPVQSDGRIVALVSVGITTTAVERSLLPSLLGIAVAAGAVLLAGSLGAWLIGRRLERQTEGLAEPELRQMVDYYDTVLHAVREGMLILDRRQRVRLANDEAVRLLSLPADPVGRPLEELGLPGAVVARIGGREEVADEIFVIGEHVLVANRTSAARDGRLVGSVVTVRDRTDLQQATGELAAVHGLADSLRAQNHEAANRLHTVVSLVELGRTEDAVAFATRELELAQRLTDHVVAAVDDPVLAALLLGKTAQAAERGIRLNVDPDSRVAAHTFEPHDLVTILGNLVDNALDAAATEQDLDQTREVDALLEVSGPDLRIRVGDSGPGLGPGDDDRIFRRGWTTKATEGAQRGIGLALVNATVRRLGGRVAVGRSALGGAEFDVRVGAYAGPGHANGSGGAGGADGSGGAS